MFSSKTTTLFTYLTLILVATAVEAHSLHEARGHAQLKRIIKKRAPQGGIFDGDAGPILGPIGAAPVPNTDTATPSAESSGASVSASASGSASGSASASASVSASGSASVSASSASVSASASASSSASVSASASESSAAPVTDEPPQVTDAPAGPTIIDRSTSTRQPSTKVVTKSVEAEETAPPSMAGAAAKDQTKSNIATILIAVVASIGGVFILWTIFRKWKLGSSKKFDQRMQPIDWEKTDDTHHRRQSDSSFHSSSAHSTRSPTGLRGVPDHDFTAGPSRLSPVGGYADMSRGPSPQFGNNGRY